MSSKSGKLDVKYLFPKTLELELVTGSTHGMAALQRLLLGCL